MTDYFREKNKNVVFRFSEENQNSPPERTIHCAAGAFVATCWLFAVAFTGAFTFAHPHDAEGDNDHGQDDQQHYDGRQVHAMMALAMR